MKKCFKWLFIILAVTVAIVAGMYYLAQVLDSDKTVASDDDPEHKTEKNNSFSFPLKRRYTTLDLNCDRSL